MVYWRWPTLLEQARQQSGERLHYAQIAQATGLSISTVYLLTEHPPKRVDIHTLDRLLIFLRQYLGPITTNDLLEFEHSESP